MKTQNLLLEIGTEELPAKTLQKLSQALGAEIKNNLTKAELGHGEIKLFATPRRLAVIVKDLATAQNSRHIERKGPAVQAAFDEHGNPTKTGLGFAQSCGVDIKRLQKRKTDKGEFLFFSYQQPGETTPKLLPNMIQEAIHKLPIPRPMHWGSHETVFIRPVHWIVLLFGNELIKTQILGVTVERQTYGHRFLHPKPITLKTPNEYEKKLLTGKVIADFDSRKETIRKQLKKVTHASEKVIHDEELLNEVTGLVEWPVALLGNFESRFLEVPTEILIMAMKSHQKYFPVIDAQQHLLPHFVTISNIKSKNPKRVIAGNERVLRARLSDASFFYHSDLKHSLESCLEKLKTVVFQTKLGTLLDKVKRLAQGANYIAQIIGANPKHAERAGLLAKTDLLSEVVGEFPELQGIMGYYYALQDNEPEAVALGIKEQYLPRFAKDHLPESLVGCTAALADRADTLVGIFGIQQAPTGEKDPFGLRRAALGILRIIIEKQLPLDLKDLFTCAIQNYSFPLENKNLLTEVLDFTLERLRAWYSDQGISADVFAAVLARYPTKPFDFHQRLIAVQNFLTLPEAQALSAANKRVSNILKKEDGVSTHSQINPALFEREEEHILGDLIGKKAKEVEQLYNLGKYTEALATLAALQKPIDNFFDRVMVMIENENIRNNRLALLMNLRNLFLQIADVSLLQI